MNMFDDISVFILYESLRNLVKFLKLVMLVLCFLEFVIVVSFKLYEYSKTFWKKNDRK